MIKSIQQNLQRAQNRPKQLAAKGRTDRKFQVGDWVWLKLQAYKQASVQQRTNVKLGPKYFGPLQVVDTIGSVAYKLNFPKTAQIHPTVHVSQLKAFVGTLPNEPYIPAWIQGSHSEAVKVPLKVLARRVVKRKNAAAVQYLGQWKGFAEEDTTWEFAEEIKDKYPAFQP